MSEAPEKVKARLVELVGQEPPIRGVIGQVLLAEQIYQLARIADALEKIPANQEPSSDVRQMDLGEPQRD